MIGRRLLVGSPDHDFLRSLRRAWWGLSALYVSALADYAVYMIQRGERPTRTLIALGVALALLTVTSVVVARTLNEARLRRVQGWIQPARGLIAPLLLAGLFAYGLLMRSQLVYAHAALALAATAALVYLSLSPSNPGIVRSRLWIVGIVAVVAAATCIRVYALSRYPSVDIIDEPWNLSWSVTYLQTGQVGDFTVAGSPGGLLYHTTHYVPRWSIPVAWWLSVVGVGLWQGRLFSLVVMAAVILVTTLAARNLYGRAAAVFTAAALFTSALLMVALRLRHDVGLALAVAVSLWLYSEALRRRRDRWHLLAGLAMGLGGFAHYHALGFAGVAFAALYLPGIVMGNTLIRGRFSPWGLSLWQRLQPAPADELSRTSPVRAVPPNSKDARRALPSGTEDKRLTKGMWLYALGLIVGLGLVAVAQVLPDVGAFLAYRAPRNPDTAAQYVRTIGLYLGQIASVSWYEALLIAAGVIVALARRRSFDRSLVLFAVLGHFVLPAMTHMVKDHYLVPLTPVYGLLVGTLIGESLKLRRWASVVTVLVVGLCVLMPTFGQTLKAPVRDLIARRPLIDPTPPVAQWVIDHVPRDRTVMGENQDYLWLHDYRYFALWLLDFVPPEVEASVPARSDFLLSLNPDVIVFDPDVNTYGVLQPMLDDPAYLPAHGYRRVAAFPAARGEALVYARDGAVSP